MTKIKNTVAYPIKQYPVVTDFFIGSDSENNGETVNFSIQTIVNMASGLMDYIYSKSSLPLTAPQGNGIFTTNGIVDFSSITTMSVSKITLAGQNLTPYLNFLAINTAEFTLKIISKTNQNVFAYYAINTVTEFDDYFVFNVVLAPGNNYLGELENKDIYTFVYEKIPGEGPDLISQTITDGDTTHAPSGNAVFDALALINAQLVPVSATQSGIVNNVPLQELGGVDKLINGVRIGKGAGNTISNTIVTSNGGTAITTATFSTFLGYFAGLNVTTGISNTLIGGSSGGSITTGQNNTGVGSASLFRLVTGNFNTAVGQNALCGSTPFTGGDRNIGIGNYAGISWQSGSDNIFIGAAGTNAAGGLNNGNLNTVIGLVANNATNGTGNTFIGRYLFPSASTINGNIILSDGNGIIGIRKTDTHQLLAPSLTTALINSGGITSLVNKEYVDNLVVGLLDLRGNYNASTNLFPTTGGSGTAGAILKGDFWCVSVAGTLGGQPVAIGSSFYALVDTPAQIAGNWALLSGNLGYVPANDANVIHKLGNLAENFTGVKSAVTSDAANINGFNMSNTGIDPNTYSIHLTNDNSAALSSALNGINNNNGAVIRVLNQGVAGSAALIAINSSAVAGSYAITSTAQNGGNNAAFTVSGVGININAQTNSASANISASQAGSGNNIEANITTGSGFNFVGKNTGTNTYTVDKLGNVIGNTFSATANVNTPAVNGVNSGNGQGVYGSNSQAGIGVEANSTGTGIALYASRSTGAASVVLSRNTGAATGFLFEGRNSIATTTFSVSNSGDITGNSFIKTGGLATQYLMADGSVSTLTNPITGTGTTNFLPKFTGAGTLGNSLIQDNGTIVQIGGNTNIAGTGTQLTLTDATDNNKQLFLGYNNAGNYGFIQPIQQTVGYTNLVLNKDGGNVGIGTTTPYGKVNAFGDFVSTNSNFSAGTTGTATYFGTNQVNGNTHGRVQVGINGDNGTFGNFIINPLGGNVGIGITVPTSKLEVNTGDIKVSQTIALPSTAGFGLTLRNTFNSNNYDAQIVARTNVGGAATSGLLFRTGYFNGSTPVQADRMYIDAESGNIGIGTVTQRSLGGIKIVSINGVDGSLIDFATNGTLKGAIYSDSSSFNISSSVVGDRVNIRTASNANPVATFLDNGNVGIGTTSVAANQKFIVETDISSTSIIRANSTAATYNSTLFYGTTVATGSGFDLIGMYANGVAKFNVNGDGVIKSAALAGTGTRIVTALSDGTLAAGAPVSAIRTATATTTALSTDYTILADATSGALTINLPAAASVTGLVLSIKKTNNTANNVTIDPNGSEQIDFASTFVITTYLQATVIQSDGTAWYIIN